MVVNISKKIILMNQPKIQLIALGVVFSLYSYALFAHKQPLASLKVGAFAQGGVIGCLDGGLNNFIVTQEDLRQSSVWGGYGDVTQASSKVDGAKNTKKIVDKNIGVNSAASLCIKLRLDDHGRACESQKKCYNDWFLPSQEQLNCLFRNRNKIGAFYQSYYWSSTESSRSPKYTAFDQNFMSDDVEQFETIKNTSLAVRCIRPLSLWH